MTSFKCTIQCLIEENDELDVHKLLSFLLDNRRIIKGAVIDVQPIQKPEATKRGQTQGLIGPTLSKTSDNGRDTEAMGNED